MSNKSNFFKYLSNTYWLFTEKIFTIIFGMITTILIARYLGAEQFGTYNYVVSFVSLFGVIATLGMERLVAKEVLIYPENMNEIMGSSFFLRFVGAFIVLIASVYAISIVRPDDEIVISMTVIIASALFFKSFDVIRYLFEAKSLSKYIVILNIIGIIISFIIKLILLFMKAPLIAFAFALLIDGIFLAIGYLVLFPYKFNNIFNWKISFYRIKLLLKDGLPLILTGAVYLIFVRVDQIMLGNMAGDKSVGIYAAAVKLSESWLFVPGVIATSYFPALLNARKRDYSLYIERTQHLLNFIVLLGVFVAFLTMIFSPFVIQTIFGNDYSEASLVLTIHIWGMVFSALTIMTSRYFLVEELQMFVFYRALAGLMTNIALNFLLIPLYDVLGAAIATVISQFISVYLLNFLSPKTRTMFYMQTRSLMLYDSFNSLMYLKSLRT